MKYYQSHLLAYMLLLSSAPITAVELESEIQKFSYSIGIQAGNMLKGQNLNEIDADAFAAAVDDAITGKPIQLSKAEIEEVMKRHFERQQEERDKLAQANDEKGKAFLADNAKKEGVTTLDNGLQYRVVKDGTGASPKAEQRVEVNYRGRLIDGQEFDSSYKHGTPVQFNLNQVIPGFKEAITRMKPGAQWEVYMPAELAYGQKGASPSIGPNETLIFDVEFLRVVEEKTEGKPEEKPEEKAVESAESQ
jgi:FKBP-type peptidyl-prolyl cis-trans isomerase FklB